MRPRTLFVTHQNFTVKKSTRDVVPRLSKKDWELAREEEGGMLNIIKYLRTLSQNEKKIN